MGLAPVLVGLPRDLATGEGTIPTYTSEYGFCLPEQGSCSKNDNGALSGQSPNYCDWYIQSCATLTDCMTDCVTRFNGSLESDYINSETQWH